MESEQPYTLESIIPPSPFTQRGYSTSIDINEAKKILAYCVQNVIVLRDLTDLKKCDVFTQHGKQTTAVRFTKSGNIACSGDIEGNIIIWETYGTKPIRKQFNGMLNGAVRDISWTSDNQRLVIVGEGKQVFGKAILADTGSTVGDVSGTSKILLAADIRPERPFKLAYGGEEFIVCFSEGPPFKYKHFTKSHTNYVNSIRYKPNGEVYVSASTDKKLVLYEGKTGEELQVIEKAHDGGISRIAWFNDNLHFATSSTDKSVKIWAHEGHEIKNINTLKISQNQSQAIEDQQVSVATFGQSLLSVSLSGNLNYWDNLNSQDVPNQQFIGHQTALSQLLITNDYSTIVANDRNGRILLWRDGVATLPTGEHHSLIISRSSLSQDSQYLYSIDKGGNLKKLNINENKFVLSTKIEKGVPVGLVASKHNNDYLYVLYENGKVQILNADFTLSSELQVKSENDFSFIEISHDGQLFALGDSRGIVYLVNSSDGSQVAKLENYGNKITVLRFSHNDQLLAVGESAYKIRLWNVPEAKVLTNSWSYHAASISDIIFTNSDQYAITCSQDNKVCIFNTQSYELEGEYKELHKQGIFGVVIDQQGRIISGGGDALIKITKNKNKQFF